MNSPGIYIEIGQQSLKLLRDGEGMELLLERGADGRLTSGCKDKLISALRGFLKKKNWQAKARAVCAISANGVSVRRLSVPAAATPADFQRVLALQVEAEFPLPPDELAWGWLSLGAGAANGAPAKTDILVAAVRKEMIADYSAVFTACDLNPVFTLAAISRSVLCPTPPGSCAMLDVGRKTSELALFENGAPRTLRVLPYGHDDFFGTGTGLDSVAQNISGTVAGGALFITGDAALHKDFAAQLSARLPRAMQCTRLETMAGEGRSPTTLALKKSAENNGGPALLLRTTSKAVAGKHSWSHPAARKLILTGVALLLGVLLLPFVEPLVLKPFLVKKLAALKSDRGRLPMIDRELEFLDYLKQSQPPALDVLYVFAKSAPSGAKIDSITLDRRGDISMRGSMQNGDLVAEFRSKLIASGCFAAVSVDEQSPTPDRQKVNVRLTAKVRPAAELAGLSFGPTTEEIEKAKSAPKNTPGGAMPPGAFPGGLPPGAIPAGMPAGVMRGGLLPGVMPAGVMPARGMPAGMMPAGAMSPGGSED